MDTFLTTFGGNTSYTTFTEGLKPFRTEVESDHVYRVITTSAAVPEVTMWETAELRARFDSTVHSLVRKVNTLKCIVKWQRQKLDYQAMYTAYLLGTLPEDEFLKDSDRYVALPCLNVAPAESLGEQVAEISQLTEGLLDPVDTAEFLGLEVDDVLRVIDRSVLEPPQGAVKVVR